MDKYIKQLIEDMKLAAKAAPKSDFSDDTKVVDDEQSFLDHIEQVERYLHGPTEKLGEIVGIPISMLPLEEKLNENQVEVLVDSMEKLLQAYNFHPEYPVGVPARMLYKALCVEWKNEFALMDGGMSHIEFCNELPEECAFPGYCEECKRLSEDVGDDIMELGEFDDDFLEEFNEKVRKNQEKLFGMDNPKRTNTDDEGFIPGVYNYCDRWCEHCDFTDVCRTFSMEKEFRLLAEKRANKAEGELDAEDVSDDELMAAFDFDDEDDDSEEGDNVPMDDSIFDMDFDVDPDDYEDPRKDFFSPQNKAERHPLTVLVDKFMDDSNVWIEAQYKEVEENFTKYVAIGDTDELMEAFEVIMRYHFFVPVKLRRALSGYFEQEEDEFEAYDMNGTAKVMLIAIDDSLLALKVLTRFFKDKKDIIDKLTAQLTEILAQAEGLFPDARAFIRPGLDE